MKRLLKNIQINSQIILLSLVFYGLSIAILLKEINLVFLPQFDLHILFVYRILIIIICLISFFFIEKKFTKIGFILITINTLFLLSTLFFEEIKFSLDGLEYLRIYNTSLDTRDLFFSSKVKILIINIFNIILPTILILLLNINKFNIDNFKKISLKICDFNLIILFLFVLLKHFYIKFFLEEKNIEFYLINIHSLVYILNIHFLIIIDDYFIKKEFSKASAIKILGIFVCLSITKSYIFLLICISSFLLYFIISSFDFKKLFIYIFLIILFILTYIFYEYIYYNSTLNFVIYEPGTILNSIFIRIKNIEYYLYYSTNLNLIFGNNIFSTQAATYPHNFFVDLVICTGILGTTLFIFLVCYIIKNIKIFSNKNMFFLIVFIQSLIFSIFSGFLFTNIVFNISLAILLCFISEKDEKIIKNSLG